MAAPQSAIREAEAPAAPAQDTVNVRAGDRRRGGERRGMDQLRAEALQAVISKVEDKHFGGLRDQVQWNPLRGRMKPSRILLLLVALLAGGVAAYLATQRPSVQPSPAMETEAPPAPVMAKVLVAVEDIGLGQRLTPISVEWQDWPTAAVRPEYITADATPEALTDMSGALARSEIYAGEPIRASKLVRAEDGLLSAVLEPGMRGVSVTVGADAASGGFVLPNDHVDVVLTRLMPSGLQESETILHNVRVLAINARLGETGTTGAPENPDEPTPQVFRDVAIATLALDPVQAEIVINALGNGNKLTLILRSMADFAEPAKAVERNANQAIRMTSPFWVN